MKQGILYSMCWEDHDLLAQNMKEGDRVLSVCSGGELALEGLLKHPESIDVVDTNPDQLNLFKLKLTLFEKLNYAEAMEVLGCFENPKHKPNRQDFIRSMKVSKGLESWMDQWKGVMSDGLIHAGKFDRYLKRFSTIILPLVVKRKHIDQFLLAKSLKEQNRIYNESIDNWRYRLLFKWFFGRFYMSRSGRHPDLLKHVEGDLSEAFYHRMKHAWTEVPIHENYFLRMIIEKKWRHELPYPRWASRDSFESVKRQCSSISLHLTPILDHLQQCSRSNYDVIYLSDITETMTRKESNELFDLCYSALRPNGKLLVWNNLVERKPDSKWELQKGATDKFWEARKVSFYGFLGIFTRKEEANL